MFFEFLVKVSWIMFCYVKQIRMNMFIHITSDPDEWFYKKINKKVVVHDPYLTIGMLCYYLSSQKYIPSLFYLTNNHESIDVYYKNTCLLNGEKWSDIYDEQIHTKETPLEVVLKSKRPQTWREWFMSFIYN